MGSLKIKLQANVLFLSRVVWGTVPRDVDFPNQHKTPHGHGDRDDGKVNTRKLMVLDMYVLPSEDVPPEKASQRCAKGCAESSVVDAESHAINGGPEGSVTNGGPISFMDLLPCLDDAG